METIDSNDNNNSNSSSNSNSNSPMTSSPATMTSSSSAPFPIIRFLQAPVTTLIEYSGLLRPNNHNNSNHESESLIPNHNNNNSSSSDSGGGGGGDNGEVSIRIMSENVAVNGGGEREGGGDVSGGGSSSSVNNNNNNNNVDSAYQQRYDLQQVSRWIEQILPFSLLLLIVFIRQHLQDTLARQAAMAFKLVLLMYYKNGRGHSFRRQGQMLTLVEYTLLLYRAFLPAPVWYRFFLNKEYGSLFSSLTTGLYLTLKLTSCIEKVSSFYAALKALSRKEVNYGSHATPEQVSEAGDLCAICQEKMQAPILLRCKHIFCEDCVSEWFERERTCPLCRALVRPADIRSFGDGSTSMLFQLF